MLDGSGLIGEKGEGYQYNKTHPIFLYNIADVGTFKPAPNPISGRR